MGPRQGGEVRLFAKIMARLPKSEQLLDSMSGDASAPFIQAGDLLPCAEASWQVGCRPRTAADLASFRSEQETITHLRSVGLPQGGVEYVIQALKAPPSRKVGGSHQRSRVGEIRSYVQSGFRAIPTAASIQFESSSEHDFAICLAANPSTLFLIDQPTTIFASWPTSAGRTRSYQHTPDYLAIHRDNVVAYEVKPLGVLRNLLQDNPHLWAYEGGQFTYLPVEKHYRALGIVHRVVPSETISWIYSENLRILASQAVADLQPNADTNARIRRAVEKHQPTSLAALVDRLQLDTGTDILRAILDSQVYVDLQRCSLWDAENTVICSNEADARHVGMAIQAMAAEASRGSDAAWLTCHPKHLPLVGLRLAIATGADTSEFSEINTFKRRTIERIKKAYRERGLAGLYPNWDKCGRKRKYTEADESFAIDRIRIDRASTNHESVQQSYARYKLDLVDAVKQGRSLQLIGLSMYYLLWNRRRHNVKDAYGVGGKRKASSDSPYGDPKDQKPICTLPFQVAHSDHCALPVFCQESDKLPQLSSLVCHLHKEVLAAVIRFAPASTTTLALLIRQCVRRHGYLPRYIYSDLGSDYRSKQFAVSMAELGVSVMRRPSASAKSGSEIERYHWTMQETAIKGGIGYVPSVKSRRGVSSSHQPENLPKRKLRDLLADINIAVDKFNDGSAYENGINLIELRQHSEDLYGPQGVPCALDFKFHVSTSPFIGQISGMTEARGAIRWQDRRYYSPVLAGRSIRVSKLDPRLDPESGGSVMYFWLDDRWHTAICRERLLSGGRSLESILLEAAHDCTAKSDSGGLLPLHEAIESARRARAADTGCSRSDAALPSGLGVAVSDSYQPEQDSDSEQLRSNSSPHSCAESQLNPASDGKRSSPWKAHPIDDWDGLDVIDVHDSDAM